jgi:hypothetical protein
MATRTQTLAPPASEEEVLDARRPQSPAAIALPEAPTGPALAEAESLVRQIRARASEDPPPLVDRLHRCLIDMPAQGGPRAAADFLVRQLEGGTFAELEDQRGRSTRAAAVRALLALGYPYALEVSPEDLGYLRAEDKRRRSWTEPAAGAVVVAGAAAGALVAAIHPPLVAPAAVPLALGSVLGGLIAAFNRSGTRGRALGMGLLATVMVGGVVLAAAGGIFEAITALASLVAVVLLSLRR